MCEGVVCVCVCVFGRSPRFFLTCPPYRRDSPGDIVVGKKDRCPPGDNSEDITVLATSNYGFEKEIDRNKLGVEVFAFCVARFEQVMTVVKQSHGWR